MRIDVLTLFPEMFKGPVTSSILQRASSVAPPWNDGAMEDTREDKPLRIFLHDLREWGLGKHRQVDDTPYGGGAGMVLRADVVVPAIEAVIRRGREESEGSDVSKGKDAEASSPTSQTSITSLPLPYRIFLSPRGKRLTQARVEKLARHHWLLLLAGHYEGIDQRIIDGSTSLATGGGWIDEEISIGDYVLTGGELPAMVLIDAVARQIPGVLGTLASAEEESFSRALRRRREYPHYTRPEGFRGLRVPAVLLSGNHKKIEDWRRQHVR